MRMNNTDGWRSHRWGFSCIKFLFLLLHHNKLLINSLERGGKRERDDWLLHNPIITSVIKDSHYVSQCQSNEKMCSQLLTESAAETQQSVWNCFTELCSLNLHKSEMKILKSLSTNQAAYSLMTGWLLENTKCNIDDNFSIIACEFVFPETTQDTCSQCEVINTTNSSFIFVWDVCFSSSTDYQF